MWNWIAVRDLNKYMKNPSYEYYWKEIMVTLLKKTHKLN